MLVSDSSGTANILSTTTSLRKRIIMYNNNVRAGRVPCPKREILSVGKVKPSELLKVTGSLVPHSELPAVWPLYVGRIIIVICLLSRASVF